jgi:SOS response regulatory protein OraA/RecX
MSRRYQWENLEPEEAQRKLYGFLARRGFSFETSRRVWARFEAGEE